VPPGLDAPVEFQVTTAGRPSSSGHVPAVYPAVRGAFGALEAEGVQWCLLRGETELLAPNRDVDVLVTPTDMRRVRKALKSVGFAPLRAWGRKPHHFLVAGDKKGTRTKLDPVTALAFGRHHELRANGTEGCLARRRYVGELAVLGPNDAFWTLLLHCMLDRRSFPVEYRRRLLELAGAADSRGAVADLVERIFAGSAGARVLLELVRSSEWAILTAISEDACAGWPVLQRLGMRLVVLKNRALRASARRVRLSRWPV
jgi:hypothetical protein